MSDAADSKTVMQILSGIAGILTGYQPVDVDSNIDNNANGEKRNNIDTNIENFPDNLQQKNNKFVDEQF